MFYTLWILFLVQGWIYWGGGVHPLTLATGSAIFYDKEEKENRSSLSNTAKYIVNELEQQLL